MSQVEKLEMSSSEPTSRVTNRNLMIAITMLEIALFLVATQLFFVCSNPAFHDNVDTARSAAMIACNTFGLRSSR